MSKLIRRFRVNDVLTDMDSVVLSDPDDTFGVKRNDTDAVIVANNSAMTRITTGVYEYEWPDPAFDLTYTYWVEAVLTVGGSESTYRYEGTIVGPTSSNVLDLTGVKDYIKRRLGYPSLYLELTESQLDDAVNDALRLFNRYMLVVRNNVEETTYGVDGVATNNVGSVVIDLPSTVIGVWYVCFLMPEQLRIVSQMSIFEIMYRMVYPPMDIGTWYMQRAFYEMYQRMRGTEPDYRYDIENRKLFVDGWSGPYDIYYMTTELLTIDTILSGSKQRWTREFLDAGVAYAKQTLSMVRGKWNATIPAPGGNLTTDADKLANEADKVLTAIEDKLKKSMKGHYLPQVG